MHVLVLGPEPLDRNWPPAAGQPLPSSASSARSAACPPSADAADAGTQQSSEVGDSANWIPAALLERDDTADAGPGALPLAATQDSLDEGAAAPVGSVERDAGAADEHSGMHATQLQHSARSAARDDEAGAGPGRSTEATEMRKGTARRRGREARRWHDDTVREHRATPVRAYLSHCARKRAQRPTRPQAPAMLAARPRHAKHCPQTTSRHTHWCSCGS